MTKNSGSCSYGKPFICSFQIENFPSRYEIFKLLESFLSERHLTTEYETFNKANKILLLFKETNLPLEFSKVLQTKKDTLPIYNKITTQMSDDLPKEFLFKNYNNSFASTRNYSINNSQLIDSTREQQPILSKKQEFHINSIKKVISKPARILLTNGNAYSSSLPRGRSLINSVPFIEQEKIDYLDHLEEKRKWLIGKDFNVNTIQARSSGRMSEIPNYVHKSPSRYPVHLHQFRDINKNKWIGKDFTFGSDILNVKHSPRCP